MTWNHPSPDMRSGVLWTEEPPCRPRVYRRRVTGNWFVHCPAHPSGNQISGMAWGFALRVARNHATLYRGRQ